MDFSESLMSRIEQLKSYIIRCGFEIPPQDAGLHAPIVELKDFEEARSIKRRRVGNTNYEQPSLPKTADHSDYSVGPSTSRRSDVSNTFSLNQVLNSHPERSHQDSSQSRDHPAGPFMNNTYTRNSPRVSSSSQPFLSEGFPLGVPSNGDNFSDLTGLRFSESPQPQPQSQQVRPQSSGLSRPQSRPLSRSQSANSSLTQPNSQFLSHSHIDTEQSSECPYKVHEDNDIEQGLHSNSNRHSLDIVEEEEEQEEEEQEEEDEGNVDEDEEQEQEDEMYSTQVDRQTPESYEEISQKEVSLDMNDSEYRAQMREEDELNRLQGYQSQHSLNQRSLNGLETDAGTPNLSRSMHQEKNKSSRYDNDDVAEQEQLESADEVRDQVKLRDDRLLQEREEELRQEQEARRLGQLRENRRLADEELHQDTSQRSRKLVTPNGKSTPSRSFSNSHTSRDGESSITRATSDYVNIAPGPRSSDRQTSTPSKNRPHPHSYIDEEPSELDHGDTRNLTHDTPSRIQQSPGHRSARLPTRSTQEQGDASSSLQSAIHPSQSSRLSQMFTSKLNSDGDRSQQSTNASLNGNSQGNASQASAGQREVLQENDSISNASQGSVSREVTSQDTSGQRLPERRGRKPGKSSRYSMSHINKIMSGEIKPDNSSREVGNQTVPAIPSKSYSHLSTRAADATDPGHHASHEAASQHRQKLDDIRPNQSVDSSANFYSAIDSFNDKSTGRARPQVSNNNSSDLDVRFSITSPDYTGSSSVSTIKGGKSTQSSASLRGDSGPSSANNSNASIHVANKSSRSVPSTSSPRPDRSSTSTSSANNSRTNLAGNSSTDSVARGYRNVNGLPGSWPNRGQTSSSPKHSEPSSQLVPPVVEPSEARNNTGSLQGRRKLQRKVYEVSNIDATLPDISDMSVRSEDIHPLRPRPRLD